MIYEIINPSDPYTLESDDTGVAAVACLLIGDGQYALTDEKDDQVCPMFLFGMGGDPAEWVKKTFGKELEEFFDDPRLPVVLDSILICDRKDRQTFYDAIAYMDDPEKIAKFKAEFHDKRCSSMNDIGGYAYRLAKNLRKSQTAKKEGKPNEEK